MKFPRSTYYKTLVRVPSNKHKEYEEFGRKVKQVSDGSKQRYRAAQICHTLNDNGTFMTADLAVQAVKNACLNARDTEGIILYSDLAGQVFENYLTSKEILHSYSRKRIHSAIYMTPQQKKDEELKTAA